MNCKLAYFYFVAVVVSAVTALWGIEIAGAALNAFAGQHVNNFNILSFESPGLLGNIIGQIFSGIIADKYGRKRVLIISCLGLFLTFMASIIFVDTTSSYIERFLINIFVGMTLVGALCYLIEIAPVNKRGKAIAIHKLFVVFGTLVSYIFNYMILYFYHDSANVESVVLTLYIGIFLVLIYIIPESFRWLAIKDEPEKALINYEKFNYESFSATKEMESFLSSKIARQYTWLSLITKKKLRLITLLAMGIYTALTLTQVTSIVRFEPYILEESGINLKINSLLFSMLLLGIFMLSIVVSFFLIDTLGRRKTAMISLGGMIISYVLLSTISSLVLGDMIEYIILCAQPFLLICFYGLGCTVVVSLIVCELFPTAIRARGISLLTVVSLVIIVANQSLFFKIVNTLGLHGFFWVANIFAILALTLITEFIPETKDMILEKIEV